MCSGEFGYVWDGDCCFRLRAYARATPHKRRGVPSKGGNLLLICGCRDSGGESIEAPAGIQELHKRLRDARAVAVLTGSGISSESGLPTFRGNGGLWRTHRVEELASPIGFARDPRLVWTWYNERRAVHMRSEPSPAHVGLAALEHLFTDFTLVTQNVDSLHRRAGSRNVLELHGQLREARCTECAERRSLDEPLPLDEIAHACGGSWRPDIVWFGEKLAPLVWSAAVAAAERADVMLVIGTSAMVNPAAQLATRYARLAYVVEINPEETPLSRHAALSIRARAHDVVPALASAMHAERLR